MHDTQVACKHALVTELSTCFSLIRSAPICQGWLQEQLGYLEVTATAQSILDGSFVAPPYMDPATKLLLDKISCIAQGIVGGSIVMEITLDNLSTIGNQKSVPECTSLSYLALHFGQYMDMATTNSEFLAILHAAHLTAFTWSRAQPEQWSFGLTVTVMLEKIAGVTIVNILCSILIEEEANFIFHNKLIFGRCMLKQACLLNLIPGEQFSEKHSTANDGGLEKFLLYDVSSQAHQPAAVRGSGWKQMDFYNFFVIEMVDFSATKHTQKFKNKKITMFDYTFAS